VAGARDLYAALREGVAATGAAPDRATLAALIADLRAGGEGETAARLAALDAGLLVAVMRWGAGIEPVAGAAALARWLPRVAVAEVFAPPLAAGPLTALPTRGERAGMPAFSDPAFDAWFAATGARYGLGLYGEDRRVYATAQFADPGGPERRTRHLGIDVFAPAGTAVHAPLPGRVESVVHNPDPLDYGHTLILSHDGPEGVFHTLYGHLGASLPALCRPGQRVAAGQVIAHLGDWPENGGWAPHLHLQVIADLWDQRAGNFFGVGHAGLWPVWTAVSPDPNLILRLPPGAFAWPG
jgi:murein DD-endopeptidase MepM/ murein hydrolase activator NlpD